MPDYRNIAIYLRAEDTRMLIEHGHDPDKWVRDLVRWGLDRERARGDELRRPGGTLRDDDPAE
jgi:hypothetical protein